MMYERLRETHPRLGKAAYGAWFELDVESGERLFEVLRHDETSARCERCGGVERRQEIVSRTLVGVNAGDVHPLFSRSCPGPCANQSSNYRRPWRSC